MTVPTCPVHGEIRILQASLTLNEPEQLKCERLLSPDELQRANRLLNRLARNRFVAGRAFLRQTLADFLSLDPAQICLSTNAHKKPRLSGEQSQSGLSFNLSHSEDRAILALTRGCDVGVDIEYVRKDLAFRPMAQRFFSPREQTELFNLPPELQLDAFYRCWTRKEAYLKGCGSGFSLPSNSFDVSLLPGHPPSLRGHRISMEELERWHLVDIPVPDCFCATLAHNAIVPVRCVLSGENFHPFQVK